MRPRRQKIIKLRRKAETKMTAIILVVIVVVAIAAAVYYLQFARKPVKTIKIGYVAPFTGPAAEFGTNGWRGISIALEEINEEGINIGGATYKIEIIRYDDRCEPSEAAAAARRLILEDKVVALLGSHCSSCCMAVAPLCDEYKVPGITIECAADAVTSPGHEYYFRMRPSMGLMAPLITPVIVEKLNPSTVAFIAVDDDYGRSFVESFKTELSKSNVETVYEAYFERGTTDYYPYLTSIKSANPDICFYVGTTPEGALILSQARELGMIPGIKFIGSEEMGEYELVKLAGNETVEDTYAISLWAPNPKIEELAAKVKEKFNAPMHYAIVFGYDALYVLVEAIKKAQSLDPVAIKNALDTIEYDGLEGHIKFEDFEVDGVQYLNQGRWVPYLIVWHNGDKELVG